MRKKHLFEFVAFMWHQHGTSLMIFFPVALVFVRKEKKWKHSWYYSKIVLFIKAFFKVFHCWWIFPKAAAFSWVIHDTFIPISRVESIPTRDNAKIVPIFECQWNGFFFWLDRLLSSFTVFETHQKCLIWIQHHHCQVKSIH